MPPLAIHELASACLRLARDDDLHAAVVLGLDRPGEAQRPLRLGAAPVCPHGTLRMLGDLARDGLSLVEGLTGVDEPLDQADLQRLRGRHGATRAYEVEGAARAQHARYEE